MIPLIIAIVITIVIAILVMRGAQKLFLHELDDADSKTQAWLNSKVEDYFSGRK